MNTAIWLLTGFLLSAAPGETDPIVPPRLEKGLEILWKGKFNEAVLHPSKSFRNYDIEVRAFVIDVCEKGSDVGIMTTLHYRPELKVGNASESIRLEIIRVDPRGNVSLIPAAALNRPPEKRQTVPLKLHYLQGLPTFEVGMFLAVPEGKLHARQTWDVPEENRPPRSWKLDSVDLVKAARCIRIIGHQQTADFDRTAITRPQWRRAEIVWIADRTGYAAKVERVIEKRTPDGGDVSFKSKLIYESEGRMDFRGGPLFEAQKEEIVKAAIFGAELQQLLDDERKADPELFGLILKQIAQHEQSHLSGEYVPYRTAILALKRRTEAAKNGHIPPASPPPETADPPSLAVGSAAPDFSTRELSQDRQVRLSHLRGKPIVLLYYQPNGKGSELVLQLAQNLFTVSGQKAYVLSVAVGVPEQSLKQRAELKLTIPILSGREVYKLHGITATPEIVIMDDTGMVRKVFVGWTDETANSVRKELDRWVK